MSRYYNIAVTGDGGPPITFTSFPNKANDPSALDIELDISVAQFSTPAGKVPSYISIWGVPQKMLSQAPDFNGRDIEVSVGMQKGLPLANPMQAGQAIKGTILQAFTNWLGVEQTLNFYIGVEQGSNATPLNLVLNWTAGQRLDVAIKNTLKVAYPGYTINNMVDTSIVQTHDEVGIYYTISEFAVRVKELSQSIVGGDYTGVELLLGGDTFNIFDGTSDAKPRQIAFTDLIGQPAWQEPGRIQVITVMRADISANDVIQLPMTPLTNTAGNLSQYADRSSFQGKFRVGAVRHVGRFRQADAQAWITVLECYGNGSGT